jgi:hypothetical protein
MFQNWRSDAELAKEQEIKVKILLGSPNRVNYWCVNNGRQLLYDTFLSKTPIFEWYMVWCGSKNVYQEDMWSEEIEPKDVVVDVNCSKCDI